MSTAHALHSTYYTSVGEPLASSDRIGPVSNSTVRAQPLETMWILKSTK